MSETICSNGNNVLKKLDLEDRVWYKSLRLTINLLISILIFLTVFVCCLFACDAGISVYTLHIILCVLGFQFFTCQGMMIMSKYNSWSVFICRRYKRNIHIMLHLVGALLATVGIGLIISLKHIHFTTIHGKLGLVAFIFCLASIFSGSLAMYSMKLACCIRVYWTKLLHYITGTASIFLATASLCAAFQYQSFTTWIAHDNATSILIAFTWLFTVLVSLERLINIAKDICNKICF